MYRRIRDLREDSDLTQREMGEILHCSQRVYSNYERGDLDIPTDILIKLAKFYHVSTGNQTFVGAGKNGGTPWGLNKPHRNLEFTP